MGMFKTKEELEQRKAELQAELDRKRGRTPAEQPAPVQNTPAPVVASRTPGVSSECPDPEHHYVVKYGMFTKGKLTEHGAAKELNEMYARGYVIEKMFTDPHDFLVKVFAHAGH
jgi:hypothetical protein